MDGVDYGSQSIVIFLSIFRQGRDILDTVDYGSQSIHLLGERHADGGHGAQGDRRAAPRGRSYRNPRTEESEQRSEDPHRPGQDGRRSDR